MGKIRSWLESIIPDYSGVGEAMPEHIGRERLDPISNAAVSLTTLPKRMIGASEQMRTEGPYNPEPAVETAMNVMGVGSLAGVSAAPMDAIFGSGILRRKPVIGGYHGTVAPEKFSSFKPSEVDFGTHFATDPNVSAQYALRSHTEPFEKLVEGARTVPVVGDVQKPLKYPTDPINWKDPEWVIGGLKEGIEDYGFKAPKGILDAMIRAEKDAGGWEKNFIPMLKDKKYDSILYPHSIGPYGDATFNSYMALDPGQVKMRLSAEGQELIRERGIKEPGKQLFGIKSDVKEWNSLPETEKWLPPPTGPKPSSAQHTTLTQKPMDLIAFDKLLKDQKAGLITDGKEFWKQYKLLTEP